MPLQITAFRISLPYYPKQLKDKALLPTGHAEKKAAISIAAFSQMEV